MGLKLDELMKIEKSGLITHYYHMVWVLRQLSSRLISLSG